MDTKTPAESSRSLYENTIRYLPKLVETAIAQYGPIARTKAAVDTEVSPKYAESNVKLLEQFGPRAAEAAAAAEKVATQRASERELGLATGTGRDLVKAADELQRTVDPEFYALRENVAKGLQRFMGEVGPDATEGELEEARRGLGLVRSGSAIDTLSNVLTFGNRRRQRALEFGSALGAVTAQLPAIRSNLPAFEIATRRQVGQTGQDRVPTTVMGTGGDPSALYGPMMGAISPIYAEAQTKNKSTLDKVREVSDMIGSFIGSIAGAMI